jgi:malate dehydrogenase (oxaloacetate-decarboxylating)
MQSGAVLAADGKSVNNVLGFPGILCGAVDSYATHISHEMYFTAAQTIADQTHEDEFLPNPLGKSLHQAVALEVVRKAVEQGIAREEFFPGIDI